MLLNLSQHSYRRALSTNTAVIQLVDEWTAAIDQGRQICTALVDLSLAFDLVDMNVLLAKMRLYGFTEQAIDWFQSYLTEQSQKVSIGGQSSKTRRLTADVPQGSILEPVLYVLMTNEQPKTIHWERLNQGKGNRQGKEQEHD